MKRLSLGFVLFLSLISLLVACSQGVSTPSAPTVASFSADADAIVAGESTTLRWSGVSAGAALTLEPGMGDVTGDTSAKVSPTETTTYTLTASNSAGSNSYEQTITVTPAPDTDPSNQAPTAEDLALSTQEATALSVQLSGNDEDDDPLSYSILSEPTYGVLSDVDASTGTLIYTPNASFSGEDSFGYRVSDGAAFAEATVTITVNANLAPAFSGVEDESVLKKGGELSFGLSDPEGLEVAVEVGSSDETVVPNSGLSVSCAEGRCTLSISPLSTGDTTLTLTATDDKDSSATATLELNVYDQIVETLEESGEGSLREVLAGAADGEVIGLPEDLSGQTLTLTEELVVNNDVTLQGNITLSAEAQGTVLSIQSGATLVLKDVTVTQEENEGALALSAVGETGALYNQGTLVLSGNARVVNSLGIVNEGTLTLEGNVSVSGNTAENGGGITNSGTLTLKGNASVSGNTATTGGGIYNSGDLTLQGNASVSGNTATTGGGIFNSGFLTLKGDASISGNEAAGGNGYVAGGGIYNDNSAFQEGVVVSMEERASVTGNSAPVGGGIYNRYGSLILKGEASISDNLARLGAGLYSDEAYLLLADAATISANGDANTHTGGGIYAYLGFADGLDFDGQGGDDNVFDNMPNQVWFDYGQ